MTMSDLERYRAIDKTQLDSSRYFQSILEQAYQKGLLSDPEIEKIQFECIQLLAVVTEKYNGGDSSSIRVEKAENLMASNLYTISLWLKTYHYPDDAVEILKSGSIMEIYKNGRKRIDSRLAASKLIYKELLDQFVDIPNECYRTTIRSSIRAFFKVYYPDFGAHETHITADYPTFFQRSKSEGIEFVQEYIRCLFYENQFFKNFETDSICHLLCGYQADYKDNIFNLYRPILFAAIGCTITNSNLRTLDITPEAIRELSEKLMQHSEKNLLCYIQEISSKMLHELDCTSGLVQYVYDCLPLVASEIQLAIKEHTLERLFVLPDYPEAKPYLLVSYGSKMDNELYRKIVEEIELCDSVSEKIAIIKQEIHSLADLEDVLIDCSYTRSELRIILHELELSEITAIYRHLCPYDEVNLAGARGELLYECLKEYIAALPPNMKKIVAQALKIMREE